MEDHRPCQVIDCAPLGIPELGIVDACENTNGVVADHRVSTLISTVPVCAFRSLKDVGPPLTHACEAAPWTQYPKVPYEIEEPPKLT